MQIAILSAARTAATAWLVLTGQAQPDRLAWGACAATADTGPRAGSAECAAVMMPLRYDGGPDSMAVEVMRILARDSSISQLWFLDGGPGDAGTASLGRLARVLRMPDVDLYTVDHRGVGASAPLRCPEQEAPGSPEGREIARAEWPGCIDYLRQFRPDLDALTAENTVKDLARVIEMQRVPGKRIVVMGVSYGTYLAQRYLQQFPRQPDAVILDGIVPLDWSFAEFDRGLDTTARRLLNRCARDSACRERLGPDPARTTELLLASLAAGHCGGIGLTSQLTRLILGNMLMVDAVPHAFLMAFIYRVRRCAWHDRLAILHMFREVFGAIVEPPSHSPVLQRHVAMSELWPTDAPDSSVFQNALDGYLMTTEVSASFARTAGMWPVYARPMERDSVAAYHGPMLLLQGGLDPTMPVERLQALRRAYNEPTQSFVVFPDAGHVVINESPCAVSIYQTFIRNPDVVPDTSCAANATRLSFAGTAEQSKRIFGTADMWGDSVGRLDWLFFASLFRFPALLIGLSLLVWAGVRWRGVMVAKRPGWMSVIVRVVLWAGLCVAAWIGAFVLPLVMRYNAAVIGAVAIVVLHTAIGIWLVRRTLPIKPAVP